MGELIDELARSLARGTSRKDFLRLAGGAVLTLLAGPAATAEAKKSKGPTCAAGQTPCAASPPSGDGPTAEKKSKGAPPVCRDLQNDVNNCGACGNKCASGQTCAGGKCQLPACPTGQSRCGEACKLLGSDAANCGACGQACPSGQACCSGVCKNLQTDSTNCGSCGSPCLQNQNCCGGACTNTQTDPANCGSCGKACATGQTCANGACGTSCPSGQSNCGGACVNLQTDAANCGACGTKCGSGLSCCATVCKNLQTDSANCGTCGNSCSAGLSCCGGLCKNLQTDSANCGTCGTACSGGLTCQGGSCGGATGPGTCNAVRDGANVTTVFTSQAISDGKVVTLTETRTVFPNGNTNTTTVIKLGTSLVLQLDVKQTGPLASEFKGHYGFGFQGITDTDFTTTDGKTLQGTVDGRAVVPFALGTDLSAVKFADGKPGPVVTIDPAVDKAIKLILAAAKADTSPCSVNTAAPAADRPSAPKFTFDCGRCQGECLVESKECISTGLNVCYSPFSIAIVFLGACYAGIYLVCKEKIGPCQANCFRPGAPCCPVGCGTNPNIANNTCCDVGETCLNPGAGVCCPSGTQACNGKNCCKQGERCSDDGTCCPPAQVVCHGVCCKPGEGCSRGLICCPPGQEECGGVCCEPNRCLSGSCCKAPDRVCGSVCLQGFQECCPNAPGGTCPVGQICFSGSTCCARTLICGSVCCSGGRVCCDVELGPCCPAGKCCINGACATCPVNTIACPVLPGRPTSCPTPDAGLDALDVCCSDGTCCLHGQCCPGSPISAPGGCCPPGLQCCGGLCRPSCES